MILPQYAPGGFNGCGIGHTVGGIYGPRGGYTRCGLKIIHDGGGQLFQSGNLIKQLLS